MSATETNDPLVGTKFTMANGREVTLVARRGDHYKVEGEDGFKGWLRAPVCGQNPSITHQRLVKILSLAGKLGNIAQQL